MAALMSAQRDQEVARLRRTIALRALIATGTRQREIAASIGISQPAISQQLASVDALGSVRADILLEAAAPIVRAVADMFGYRRVAVFGSVARGDAQDGSDIDLVVEPPPDTSSFEFVRFKGLLEHVLMRDVDLISYGGLQPGIDDDVRRDAVLL